MRESSKLVKYSKAFVHTDKEDHDYTAASLRVPGTLSLAANSQLHSKCMDVKDTASKGRKIGL